MTLIQASPKPWLLVGATRAAISHAEKASILEVGKRFVVHSAKVTPENYNNDKGQLLPDTGLGMSSVSLAYPDPSGVVAGAHLDISQVRRISTGADYRFFARADSLSIENGITRWKCTIDPDLPGGPDYPQLQVFSKTAVVDPVLDSTYYYQQHRPQKRVATTAYTVNRTGYFRLRTASTTNAIRTSASFLMVFVPHTGAGGKWPIYSSRSQPANLDNERLRIFYNFGHIEIWIGNRRQATIPILLNLYEPCIFMWSWDGEKGFSQFYVQGRNTFYAGFNAKGSYYWDFNAWIGAETTQDGGGTVDWNNSADMDILEIDLWNRALTKIEMQAVVGLLRIVFGVGV